MKRRTETERDKDKVDIILKPIIPEASTHLEMVKFVILIFIEILPIYQFEK